MFALFSKKGKLGGMRVCARTHASEHLDLSERVLLETESSPLQVGSIRDTIWDATKGSGGQCNMYYKQWVTPTSDL